jgi:putative RNA 2'-phosphotransferase
MENKNLTRKSKYLSQLLRHNPGKLGLHMDQAGWVPISELMSAFTLSELIKIVENDQKQRYQMDQGHTKIRATSGHSIPGIVPDLKIATNVPEELFHGTSKENLDLIYRSGALKSMNRNYIHLTSDQADAWKVGSRHGTPVVIVLDSVKMVTDGYKFYKPVTDRYFFVSADIPVSYIKKVIWTCT